MIAPETLETVAARVSSGEVNEQSLSLLREAFPDIHFTWCMDDDIGMEKSAAEYEGFNLYLVDGSVHCLKLTTSPEVANGIVIAEIYE